MTTALRIAATIAFACLVPAPAFAQRPVAPPPHLAIDQLVKEYQRFGLPLPPKDAELVRISTKGQPPRLAFRCPPEKSGGEPMYLSGTEYESLRYSPRVVVEAVNPTLDALQGVQMGWSTDLMALAVQCRV